MLIQGLYGHRVALYRFCLYLDYCHLVSTLHGGVCWPGLGRRFHVTLVRCPAGDARGLRRAVGNGALPSELRVPRCLGFRGLLVLGGMAGCGGHRNGVLSISGVILTAGADLLHERAYEPSPRNPLRVL